MSWRSTRLNEQRDIDTAKTLIENGKFDWSLAVSYNAMLQAGRALMFDRGYRPSSTEGHVSVVKFLHASFGSEVSEKMVMVMNGMRKKRHRVVYEETDIVSEDEAKQAVRWAEEFVKRIQKAIHGGRTNLGAQSSSSPLVHSASLVYFQDHNSFPLSSTS